MQDLGASVSVLPSKWKHGASYVVTDQLVKEYSG